MTRFAITLKTLLITLSLSILLTACSSGSSRSGSNSAAAITIRGSVGDGPVTNSTITVNDAADTTVSSSSSDNQANYQASFPANTLYPVLISSTGGLDTVTLTPPDFVMISATLNSSETYANINPFSTLIVKTAQMMPGGLVPSNLIAARGYILNTMNFGLDPRLIPDPIKTPITDANVANMVKASETLAEAIRRTRRALLDAGIDINEDQIIDFLAGDISDGVIDGLGTGADTRLAATFNIITGQVLIEAIRNLLIVNGTLITTALDNAIRLTVPTATENTADVLIVATMLKQVKNAITAAQTLPLTTTAQIDLSGLITTLDGITADSMASAIDALLPTNASDSFIQPITRLATATNSELLAINTTLSDAGNNVPTITGTPATTIVADTNYNFTPTANDIDGDTLTFSITNKPLWANFDSSTGALTGTPNNINIGTTSGILISVSDAISTTSLASFDLTVTSNASTTGATVMVSTDANLANSTPLSGALLDGNIYIFFQEGSDWNTRGVNKVTFYCCKSGTEAHVLYPSVTSAPYMLNVDLTQFETGTTRELYADVFFNDGSLDSFLVNFTIATLNPNNSAPSISGAPPTIALEDTLYSFTPTANDLDGDTLTFNITNKPVWANFNTSTGALTGIPSNPNLGTTSDITISVSDSISTTSLASFDLTVTSNASTAGATVMVSTDANLTNSTPLSGALLDGNVYIFFQEGTDWNTRGVNQVIFYCCKSRTEAHTVYPSVISAPYMVNVDLTQFGSGTTRELYADVFFNDGSLDSFLVNFTIATLNPNNNAPSISGTPSTIVAEDTLYSFTPTASDIDNDTLTFTISNKPPWASFNSNTGTLTGIPNNNNVGTTSNIIIRVADRTDITALPAFNITVTNVNDAPTITGTPTTLIAENTIYSFTPTASDDDGQTLTFNITNKPLWASFNTNTGALTGTPSSIDIGTTRNIIISVNDGITSTSLASFDITVTQVVIGSAMISWIPPLENNDGSVLTDLAGYKIYYGVAAGNYTTIIDVNNIGITDFTVDNLAGPNTYYFVMTAYNSAGAESVQSNRVSKTIQ